MELIGFINAIIFILTLWLGYFVGRNSGCKEVLESFKPIIDAVSTILKELDENEKEVDDEMSVDEDHESVC